MRLQRGGERAIGSQQNCGPVLPSRSGVGAKTIAPGLYFPGRVANRAIAKSGAPSAPLPAVVASELFTGGQADRHEPGRGRLARDDRPEDRAAGQAADPA